MRKMLLCTLMGFGFMNLCVGQTNATTDKISVNTYDTNGLVKQIHLEGKEALSFDIPTYIQENDHLERLIISGAIKTDISTTIINFDSNKLQDQDGEYICKEVQTQYKPFLGVRSEGRDDLNGVDVKQVIATTAAAKGGIIINETITEFNGDVINSYCDLMSAVRSSEIGDRVELKMQKGVKHYSKYVIVGSKAISNVTYKYCQDEPLEISNEIASNVNMEEASLSTYPNPTGSVSSVNFNSASDEDVIFHVMDITGNLIHKEVFSNFNGNLMLDYNFDNQSVGTYIIAIHQGEEVYKRKVQLIK